MVAAEPAPSRLGWIEPEEPFPRSLVGTHMLAESDVACVPLRVIALVKTDEDAQRLLVEIH